MEVGIFLGLGVTTAEVVAPVEVLERRLGRKTKFIGVESKPVVGHDPGRYFRPATTFKDANPEVLVLPGGFGSIALARNDELRGWLLRMVEHCLGILTISTGSLVLASTGVLRNRTIAGHWLTGDLLHTYGAELSTRSVTTTGHIVATSGALTALEGASRLCDLIAYGGPRSVTPPR